MAGNWYLWLRWSGTEKNKRERVTSPWPLGPFINSVVPPRDTCSNRFGAHRQDQAPLGRQGRAQEQGAQGRSSSLPGVCGTVDGIRTPARTHVRNELALVRREAAGLSHLLQQPSLPQPSSQPCGKHFSRPLKAVPPPSPRTWYSLR